MKVLILVALIASVIAMAAFAQGSDPDFGTGNAVALHLLAQTIFTGTTRLTA